MKVTYFNNYQIVKGLYFNLSLKCRVMCFVSTVKPMGIVLDIRFDLHERKT